MTRTESIIMSAAQRSGIKSSLKLAVLTGIPKSTMRDKMKNPCKFTLGDLGAINEQVDFTPEEAKKLIRRVARG